MQSLSSPHNYKHTDNITVARRLWGDVVKAEVCVYLEEPYLRVLGPERLEEKLQQRCIMQA